LGVSENVTRTVMEEIYDFEAKLAAINVPIEYLRNPTLCYHKVSLSLPIQVNKHLRHE